MKNQYSILSIIVIVAFFAIAALPLMRQCTEKEAYNRGVAKARLEAKKPEKWCLRVEQYTPTSWAIAYSNDNFETSEFIKEKFMNFPFTHLYLAQNEKQATDWAKKYKNPRRLIRHNREMFKIDSLFEASMDAEDAKALEEWKGFESKKTIIDCQ